ncbi:hypothetical protein TNCV_4608691 [Trichonephila clavipes]|nr:hypothetical protein TNCV_4608691 [Trichonephila clavipes]
MATNASQDVGRSGLGHIAIRTRRVNIKTHHMPLSSSMSTAKSMARVVLSRLLPVPTKAELGWFPSYHSCTGACFQEELTSCLTRVAISEKGSPPKNQFSVRELMASQRSRCFKWESTPNRTIPTLRF